MILSIIISCIAIAVTVALVAVFIVNMVQLTLNPVPKMENDDLRFKDVKNVKTQIIFHEITK